MLLVAGCAGGPSSPAPSPTPPEASHDDKPFTTARVVEVVDGTTIDVDIGGKRFRVRYIGIEVPQAGANGASGRSLSELALDFNRFMVEGRTVDLERGAVNTDGSGNLLRYVYIDGEMVNNALLTNGLATVASFPPDFKHRTSFAIAEESAKRDQRGFWEGRSDIGEGGDLAEPTPAEPFRGGTLPLPPGVRGSDEVCDYSNSTERAIKGNLELQTGERIYYVPGSFFYSTTEITESDGDRWFCTEEEAVAAGWTKSKH